MSLQVAKKNLKDQWHKRRIEIFYSEENREKYMNWEKNFKNKIVSQSFANN